jgi:hypothetical protein
MENPMAVYSLTDNRTGRHVSQPARPLDQPDVVPTRTEAHSAISNALFLIAMIMFVASFIALRALIYAKVL